MHQAASKTLYKIHWAERCDVQISSILQLCMICKCYSYERVMRSPNKNMTVYRHCGLYLKHLLSSKESAASTAVFTAEE